MTAETGSTAKNMGFSLMVYLDSLAKRMIDGASGRGGLEAISQFLSQVDWIPELGSLRQRIKADSIFYEAALSKCNKELLKRPVQVREHEIFGLLGGGCGKCGFACTLWVMSDLNSKCPACNGVLAPVYVTVLERLIGLHVSVSPETVMMFLAYDRLAEAYVCAYEAIRLVFAETSLMFNWDRFRIGDPQMRNYLDQYFFGRLTGEQKIPAEEKQMLQFLFRGNLARVKREDAERLIRLGLNVVKYGYLYEVLGATGTDQLYTSALTEYGGLYDVLNEQIRSASAELYGARHGQKIHVSQAQGGYYAPCLIMPRGSWETGTIANDVTLEPVYRLPIFPRAEFGALQVAFASMGAGKTILLSSFACYAVLQKHELVFSPLNDKSNTFALAGVPLFGYSKRTEKMESLLKDTLGVEISGIPCLTLNVLRRRETIKDLEQHPPTKFDRILVVDDPRGFEVDFKMILQELKGIAEDFGYSRAFGMLNVRNLDRYDSAENVNIDVQVASNLLSCFDRYRKSHVSEGCRVVLDEISYLAPATISGMYGSDASRSASTISDFIKETRRNHLSFDMATQMPLEIITDIRNAATNVFFRDLALSKDKSRSQIDFLLESLQLEDSGVRAVVKDMNVKGVLPKGFWFWWQKQTRGIEVVKPCPPTFMPQDTKLTPRKIFEMYEKRCGEKILLKSWDDVPVLRGEGRVEAKSRMM